MARRGSHGLGALLEQVHMRRAGARSMQAETAQETEAIKHLRAFRPPGHAGIIVLLVEIQPRFMTRQHVCLELQTIEFDGHRSREQSRQNPVSLRQPFELARDGVPPFHDCAGGKDCCQGSYD